MKQFLLHIALCGYLFAQAGNTPTDWAEDRLKGKVRTVYTESAKLIQKDGKFVEDTRKPSSEVTYSPEGKKLKALRYDWRGNLSETVTYRIIEGDRTLKSELIRHPYDPPLGLAAPPSPNAPKWDERYNARHKRTFDEKGRLTEMTVLLGNGEMTYRFKYAYRTAPNSIEEEAYNDKGLLQWRLLRKLDDKGNVVETISLNPEGNFRYGYRNSYEFDSTGNWIKCVVTDLQDKDNRKPSAPSSIEYRKIQYY